MAKVGGMLGCNAGCGCNPCGTGCGCNDCNAGCGSMMNPMMMQQMQMMQMQQMQQKLGTSIFSSFLLKTTLFS
jgi:hypothetical protein